MSLTMITGLIGIFSLVLKYLNFRAGQIEGVAKAEAIGASDQVDIKLATEKNLTAQELKDEATIAANAHRTLLQ